MLAVLHPREGGLRRGENFWLRLTSASAQCLRLSERFYHYLIVTECAACVCEKHSSTAAETRTRWNCLPIVVDASLQRQ